MKTYATDNTSAIWNTDSFGFHAGLYFENGSLRLNVSGANSGIDFRWDALTGIYVDGARPVWCSPVCQSAPDGASVSVSLEDSTGTLRIARDITLFNGYPYIRSCATVSNTGENAVTITACRMLSITPCCATPVSLFHVEQFSAKYIHDFFRPIELRLISGRAAHELHMGSYPSQHWQPSSCAWFALRPDVPGWYDDPAPAGPGLVCGIEFNGKSTLHAWADGENAHVTSDIDALSHTIKPGGEFEIPAVFIGCFNGDWDEAGYSTQRFSEAHVYSPMPDDNYPWAQYNSWAYDQNINEAQQLQAIDRCAGLGLELAVLDLGWAQNIGDWHPDPVKFPRGLKPLAERAHSYGMRFGVHIALAQCSFDATVAAEHPDWLINPVVDYFGAAALCLGHAPCREWLIDNVSSLIRNECIDYIVQDGENMVKDCCRSDHTHSTGDSNYSNSQNGIDAVIAELRSRFPRLVIENCEDGGCMMTYKMARLYNTTITVDNIDAYSTRQGIYGASYPFSPRYSVRYMQDSPNRYTLYSSIFGGPLIFMHRVTEWTQQEIDETRRAIALYKRMRTLIRNAKIIHLLAPRSNVPGGGWGWDAIQAVAPDMTQSVVMLYRAQGDTKQKRIHPRGLCAERLYRINFDADNSTYTLSGGQLEHDGIMLELSESGAGILSIEAIN